MLLNGDIYLTETELHRSIDQIIQVLQLYVALLF